MEEKKTSNKIITKSSSEEKKGKSSNTGKLSKSKASVKKSTTKIGKDEKDTKKSSNKKVASNSKKDSTSSTIKSSNKKMTSKKTSVGEKDTTKNTTVKKSTRTKKIDNVVTKNSESIDNEIISKKRALKEEVKKTSNKKTIAKSAVKDIIEDNLDKTGAINTIKESELIDNNKDNKASNDEIREERKNSEKKLENNDKASATEEAISLLPNKEKDDINYVITNEKDYIGKPFVVDILDILIIIVITAIVSCVFTGFVLNYQYKKSNDYNSETVLKDSNVQNFLTLYTEILNNYYEDVDAEAIIKAAMQGMISYLEDTYSIYISGDEIDSLKDEVDNTYEGIGILTQGNVIVGVYKNSPSATAGIKANDEIIEINGTAISMENYITISDCLTNEKENDIVVKRGDEELEFLVAAAKVHLPTAYSTIIDYNDKKVGYIKITSFSTLTNEDFAEELIDLEDNNIDSLIIDLRNNTGGSLNAAHNIASVFLEKGKLIYSISQKDKITEYKDTTSEKRSYGIAVLINSSSASASEILAAALHDSYGATLIGKTSYGKGTVQTLKQLGDNSVVKYTSAKWFRPNGEWVNGVGIDPDYEVEIEYSEGQVYDKQLDKAIEVLTK